MIISTTLAIETSKQAQLGGKDKEIPILGYSFGVSVPTTAGSGQASGKRQYEPFHIYKTIDKSSPLLFQALVTGEVVKQAVVSIYKPDKSGKKSLFFSIKLSNARLTDLQHSPDEGEDQDPLETVSLVFEKIEMAHAPSGNTAGDELRAA